MPRFITFTALAAALASITSARYTLHTDLSYKNFFNQFSLFSSPDPTHGFVQYQDYKSAIKNQYVGYMNDSVFLGVDYKNKDPNGRASIRAESTINFNKGLLIADIVHMPDNVCGTWPAMWLLGGGNKVAWPQAGEIDILEGVNNGNTNTVTLHTTAGCTVDNTTMGPQQGGDQAQQQFSGTMSTDDCDVQAANQGKNVGCSIQAAEEQDGQTLPSYGADFNAGGGGVYALEWTDQYIQAWFIARNSSSFPNTTQLTQSPDPSSWGQPMAKFAGSGCDFSEKFKDQRIIFNTAFCGDWAGAENEWSKSCAKKTGVATCTDYVRDHPEDFEGVYWEIKGLRWFENKDGDISEKKRSVSFAHAQDRTYR